MFDFEVAGEKAKKAVMDLQNLAQEKESKIQELNQKMHSFEEKNKELTRRIRLLEDDIITLKGGQ